MECLKNYIGLRYCGQAEPESGRYINDLQGISIKQLDNLANDEKVTFLGVWDSIQTRAIQRINTAVVNYYAKRYARRNATETVVLPAIIQGATITDCDSWLRGFKVKIGGERWVDSLQVIHVQSIMFYLSQDPITVRFHFVNIDANQQVILITKEVACIAGWNSIPVNENFFGVQNLYIGYECSWSNDGGSGTISTVGVPYEKFDDCDCDCEECGLNITAGTLGMGGFTSTDVLQGISGTITAKCMYEAVVCNNKSTFLSAFWYLLGAEVMAERLYSDRLNRYTTIDLQKAKELREEFERAFANELDNAVSGLPLPLNDCCLECNAPVTIQPLLP